jgi:hypothetical protein
MLLRHANRSLAVLAVAVATTALALLLPASPADAFPDTEGTSFEEAVDALVEEEVVEGCGDGSRFCPARAVSRAQLASFLVRALDLEASEEGHFEDTSGSPHEENIDALAEAGITNGCTESEFCPQDPITRAEIASMLTRAFGTPSAGERYFDDTGGTHADAIDDLAADGIAAGCQRPPTAYCPTESVERQQAALFLARAMDLVEREQVSSLEERRAEEQEAQTAQRDAEREQMWDDLAECESGGDWQANTGNGYYGGVQFALDSWQSVGGSDYPHQHSRDEQIHRAEILLDRQGWDAWPHCSRELGYR